MKILPDNLRNIAREPIGLLVQEKELIEILKKEKKIVSVGDTVTYTLLKNNIQPVFCVVDYKTRRGNCSEEIINKIKLFGEKTVSVNNPPACITDELWNAIKNAYKIIDNTKTLIEVEGEEDLASLAAIYLAPEDVTIIYGLPDKGVLVVRSNNENKRIVKDLLDKM